MTLAVTGSTGALGSLVIDSLVAKKSGATIVALARDGAKASGLKAKGVEVRLASYEDGPALEKALVGVDRLLLVSSSEVGKRFPQHKAVVDAAKKANVKLLVYTSLAQASTSANPLAPEHKATEEYIKASGLPFVFLRNNWYTENYLDDLRRAKDTGVIAAAVGRATVASASRADYAEAASAVLLGAGHEGKTYELSGDPAWTYQDLAAVASEVLGRPVAFVDVSPSDKKAALLGAGLPEGVADFVVSLDKGIAAGSLSLVGKDLPRLLGRQPKGLKEVFAAALA